MNQKQRQHAAKRIEEIVTAKMPEALGVPTEINLHREQIGEGKAKLKSWSDIKSMIQQVVAEGQDDLSTYGGKYGFRFRIRNIDTEEFYRVDPKHKTTIKNAEKEREDVLARQRAAKAYIKKAQDHIILGSNEEALAALSAAEKFQP